MTIIHGREGKIHCAEKKHSEMVYGARQIKKEGPFSRPLCMPTYLIDAGLFLMESTSRGFSRGPLALAKTLEERAPFADKYRPQERPLQRLSLQKNPLGRRPIRVGSDGGGGGVGGASSAKTS